LIDSLIDCAVCSNCIAGRLVWRWTCLSCQTTSPRTDTEISHHVIVSSCDSSIYLLNLWLCYSLTVFVTVVYIHDVCRCILAMCCCVS